MKLLLNEDSQNMIISIERIDVDYHRVSLDTSKEIIAFVDRIIPFMTPRALSVIIQDIETEREFRERDKTNKTIAGWNIIEEKAIKKLLEDYEITTIPCGLYTRFINPKPPKKVAYSEIEIPNFSRFLKGCFIYGLPRHSYMAHTTKEYIEAYKDELTEKDKNFIIEEITKYAEKHKKEDEDVPFHDFDSHIISDWEKLKESLEKKKNN